MILDSQVDGWPKRRHELPFFAFCSCPTRQVACLTPSTPYKLLLRGTPYILKKLHQVDQGINVFTDPSPWQKVLCKKYGIQYRTRKKTDSSYQKWRSSFLSSCNFSQAPNHGLARGVPNSHFCWPPKRTGRAYPFFNHRLPDVDISTTYAWCWLPCVPLLHNVA